MIHTVHEPHGTLELIGDHATDLDVVNAARVSFANESEWGDWIEQTLVEDDAKLIGYLLKNKHGSPFEHTFMKFRVRAPIFVLREWVRHRIGCSWNEQSGRYTELQAHFYLPDNDHIRTQTGKPGHYQYAGVEEDIAHLARNRMRSSYSAAFANYKDMLDHGVAKEVARMVLPVSIYSELIWSVNARSLMNFLALRNAPTAQREIRDYAEVLENIFAEIMPVTHAAFVNNHRQAP